LRILVTAASVICLIASSASPERLQNEPVSSLLDRYYAGKFDEVVAALARLPKLDSIINGLSRDGAAWIDKGAPAEWDRRELAAATFALEAARLGVWSSWKIRIVQPIMIPMDAGSPDMERMNRPPPFLQWAPAARLIEWGCARFRKRAETTPSERWWQLGAIAVAERAEDHEFLISDTRPISNKDADIVHLRHALDRFPDEPRFLLVKAIALEWRTWPEIPRGAPRFVAPAIEEFERLLQHEAIGAEANVRLASLFARVGNTERALSMLTAVEDQTRDKYLIYLARFFRGRIHESAGRREEALTAYRGAVATMPGAQAASLALASLLAAGDRRDEAAELVDRTLNAPSFDPWRGYADADDRFWPEIIAKLRRDIRPGG